MSARLSRFRFRSLQEHSGLILLLRCLCQEFISLASLALEALTRDRVACHVTPLAVKLSLPRATMLHVRQSAMMPTRRQHSVPFQQTKTRSALCRCVSPLKQRLCLNAKIPPRRRDASRPHCHSRRRLPRLSRRKMGGASLQQIRLELILA